MKTVLHKDLNTALFNSWPRYWLDILFLILFSVVCIAYDYEEVIFERPYGNHQWRQTDCASMALNYHQDDLSLTKPQMHYRLNQNGEAVGEFPILYYIVGKLYNVFGYHEFIYRFLWLLIAFVGSFSLYRLSLELIKLPFESLMIGLMLMLSPVVGFYSVSFISDPPALFIVCIGLLLIYRASIIDSLLMFYGSIFLFLLAGLLKASALIVPFSLLGVACLYYLIKKDWRKSLNLLLGFAGIVLINYLWYSYANEFNYAHKTNYFFIRTAPAWEMTQEAFLELADIIYRIRLIEYYNSDMFLLPLAFILLGVLTWRINPWYLLFISGIFLASLLYFFMFFQQFRYHDYYMINPVILLPLLFILSYLVIDKMDIKGFRMFIQLMLIIFMAHSSLIARDIITFRYQSPENNFFLGKGYNDLEPYLDEIGIGREDLVISIPDESPNISLYLMNRKGWTNLYHNKLEEGDITYFKNAGAKYLLIGDDKLMQDSVILKFAKEEIGGHKGIRIFKL